MKDIINDYKNENYTAWEWFYYGMVAPAVLILLCVLADLIA